MNEADWLTCNDPATMLQHLRDGEASGRKLRLFAAACCRRAWTLLDEGGRNAVEAAERYAEGLLDREGLSAANQAFNSRLGQGASPDRAFFANAAVSYLLADSRADPAGYAMDVVGWTAGAGRSYAEEHAAQAGLLRDLFGPLPFRPVAVEESWLRWNDGCVAKLARSTYDGRRFDDMPILADALEEAGCEDLDLLGHCRAPGPHARGCWPLDLILGLT